MSTASLVEGVRRVAELADYLEAHGAPVAFIDIGGGLPVEYFPPKSDSDSDSGSDSGSDGGRGRGSAASCPFVAYRAALEAAVPRLFLPPSVQGRKRRLITEFGKALVATTAVALCSVQDVIPHGADEGYTCILHAGADLLLRECYCPASFRHRMLLLSLIHI